MNLEVAITLVRCTMQKSERGSTTATYTVQIPVLLQIRHGLSGKFLPQVSGKEGQFPSSSQGGVRRMLLLNSDDKEFPKSSKNMMRNITGYRRVKQRGNGLQPHMTRKMYSHCGPNTFYERILYTKLIADDSNY